MKAFQIWTPRVRRLPYDALRQDLGCQPTSGARVFASLPFERICIFDHDTASAIFNQDNRTAYASGPQNTAYPPPWPTRWAAWITGNAVRVLKAPLIVLPSGNIGSVSGFFRDLSPIPSKVTLGFTPGGLLGIAVELSGSTQVKWFRDSSGVFGDETFIGTSPVLFSNALLYSSDTAGETDLVLYYLRSAEPRSIFARFLREDFLTEHLIHSDLPVPLSKLIASEGEGGRQVLYALDSIGRDVTLRSPVYSAQAKSDKASLSAEVAAGSYRQSAVAAAITTGNKQTLAVAFESGAYSDIIVEPGAGLSGDATSLTLAFESGSYE